MAEKKFNALPGFGLTMGFTLFYLSLIVLIPMGGLFLRVFEYSLSSPKLTTGEVRSFPTLLAQLKDAELGLAKFLWLKFSEPTRNQIIARSEDTPDNPQLNEQVVAELNHALATENFYDPNRFDVTTASQKAKWLIARVDSTKPNAWLNRAVLEDAFASSVTHKSNWIDLWLLASNRRAVAAYKLTFGTALIAALANAVFGTLLAWVLVRYEFPGRRFIDAMVDFPFALPTAVAGLTLANLFTANGWLGKIFVPLGVKGAFSPLGIVIALTFVGMPFVVRTLQPVIENFEREVEESAAMLGAGRLRTFLSVIAPSLLPSIITGFALAFARAIGEYGSVVFISGNLPFKTEIAPQLIFIRLEEFEYAGAMALAVALLIFSFALLVVINFLEQWASKFTRS